MTAAPILADAIVIVHILYVGFVLLSVPLIILGGVLKWRWVHNFKFRITHLAMIGIVVVESLIGMTCPLTVWERELRPPTASYEDQDFIATWFDRLLFYHFPHWVFTTAYISFGVVIVGLIFAVPIRRRKRIFAK